MSDRKPLNQPVSDSPHSEDLANDSARAELHEDLYIYYDNSEVFYDSALPFFPRFHIESSLLENTPDVIRVEIDGENLHLAIRELIIKSFEELKFTTRPDYTKEDALRERAATLEDPAYLKAEEDMLFFFVRNFPKVLLRIYDIFNRIALLYGARMVMSPAEKQELEGEIRRQVMLYVRALHNDIKSMLQTRSSGRPRKIETEPQPEIVNTVLDTAKRLMGERRGREAVPGLKTIADQLNTSEDALGQRLRRAGYHWTALRQHLEGLT